jgi:predicted GNAT family acetyltransferase
MAAFTQPQIDALKTAIALGVTQVSYKGVTTTYRSLEEMRQTLRMMEAEVSTGGTTPRRTTFATFRRG